MDEIVAAVQFEGEVYIFTKNGTIWQMVKDPQTGVRFNCLARLNL